MSLRVRVGSGTGVEWLLAAAAVADPDWRAVFTHGEEAYAAARAAGGPRLVRDVGRFGRYGWINLAGPLTARRGAWSVSALRALVEELPAEQLRLVLAGSRRRQLRSRLTEPTLAAALGGDRGSRRALQRALKETLVQISPWLLRTSAPEVRSTCLRVLDALAAPAARPPASAPLRTRLAELGPERLLDEVAPGVHYGPGALDHVVLVSSRQAAPILVAVDEVGRTVIVHPPLDEDGATDASARLRDLGRAVGDATRMRILHQLKTGDRTLTELCAAMDSPRTTLLHHLALLRSAGLIDLSVPAGEANVYRLRTSGFESLARAARGFPLQ